MDSCNSAEFLKARSKARRWISIIIVGLIASGATAIPLVTEVHWLAQGFGLNSTPPESYNILQRWLAVVSAGLDSTAAQHPFLFYGTDWLAFGHFMIALAFAGPWIHPAKNIWVLQFGMIACVCVIPYAFIFGAIRGIPFFWRLIDCSFGIGGLLPLWFSYQWARRMEEMKGNASPC
jgi:hypothetical protein